MNLADTCVTCGTPLAGRYCYECGEKRADARDLTLRALAHYSVEAITNADAKLYTTVRALIRRPGLLTDEFVSGRRKPYVGPLQLFLLANLAFFALLHFGIGTQAFTTDLIWHRTQPLYGPTAESMIHERVGVIPSREGRPLSVWMDSWTEEQQAFRTRFNEATPRYANSMVILMIPLFALGLGLLRRRGLFVRDVVFSMHFFAFLLLYSIGLTLVIGGSVLAIGGVARLTGLIDTPGTIAAVRVMDRVLNSELFVAALVLIPTATYAGLAFRRAYGDTVPAAILRALASIGLLFVIVTVYRAILFFVVFWSA